MTAASAGLIGLVFLGLAITGLVFWIICLVEVAKIPDFQFRAAASEKLTWVLLIALLGVIPALIWRFGPTRTRVLAAAGGQPFAAQAFAPQPSPQVSAPPGWYPDPSGSGRQRWWDGVRWSEELA